EGASLSAFPKAAGGDCVAGLAGWGLLAAGEGFILDAATFATGAAGEAATVGFGVAALVLVAAVVLAGALALVGALPTPCNWSSSASNSSSPMCSVADACGALAGAEAGPDGAAALGETGLSAVTLVGPLPLPCN